MSAIPIILTGSLVGKTKKRTPIGVLENTMVGDTRFELVTPAVSRQCSPPELTAHFSVVAGVHQRVDILSD